MRMLFRRQILFRDALDVCILLNDVIVNSSLSSGLPLLVVDVASRYCCHAYPRHPTPLN
jgi:hypothetical protein